jgi:glycosyltransferase involved in cell wall biosynthesis
MTVVEQQKRVQGQHSMTMWPYAAQWEPKSVSVIIPTYNRSLSLKTTLQSLLELDYPSDRLEIIVVDNCSTDGTKSVVEACQAQTEFQVSYVYEGRQGSHFARNTGAKHAAGDVLYFTDDDMIADPGLLRNLVPVFDMYPGVASATGRILPKWEVAPPSWILRHDLNGLLGLQMRPEIVVVSDEDVGVYSGHQAVLKDVFIRSGGFNPDVVKGETVGDNEVGLNLKIKKFGYMFAYVRKAVTYHVIPSSRLTQAYLNRRGAHQGSYEGYTWYRRQRPSTFRLVMGIAEQLLGLSQAASRCVIRLLLGRDSWHLSCARIHYCISRMKCDWRLCRDERWRRLVLKDDWLEG